MNDLNELLERVKAATGPDRELDADLYTAVIGGEVQWRQANYTMDMYPVARRPSSNHLSGYEHEQVPLFTASIDAALAVVERVLPGTMWRVQSDPDSGDGFEATLVTGGPDLGARSDGATAPLAILSALLSAIIAKESSNDRAWNETIGSGNEVCSLLGNWRPLC